MTQVATDSAQFGEAGTQASYKMQELVRLSTHMQHTIAGSALRSFVEVVKLDHLIYKMEIYKVVMGVSTKTNHDFSSHHDCRLGKWYFQGEGKIISPLPFIIENWTTHTKMYIIVVLQPLTA